MILSEKIAKDTEFLIKYRKYTVVLYISPTFFGCLATWFSFRASRSLVGLSLEIAANAMITCLMFFFYKKMVAALDKTIERMKEPSTRDEYAVWAGMTEADRRDMEKGIKINLLKITSPLTVVLNLILFVSVIVLIVALFHLYFPHLTYP